MAMNENKDVDTSKESTRILSGKQNLLFNLPNFGLHVQFSLTTNFILIFYVNILGQSPIVIGGIQSVFVFLSALLCPIWGTMSDRISSKLGRKKTMMLIFGPLISLSFFLIWIPPIPTTTFGEIFIFTILWFAMFQFLFCISTSGFQSSYLAIIPEISTEEGNRLRISIVNTLFMILGAGIALLIPFLLLGDATESLDRSDSELFYPNSEVGQAIYSQFSIYAVLFSSVFLIFLFIMLIAIKEPDMEVKKFTNIKDIFKDLLKPFKDRNYRLYILSFMGMYIAVLSIEILIMNFATFVLNLRGSEFLILALAIFASGIVSFIVWDSITPKLGLRKSMSICLIISSVSFISMISLTIPLPHEIKAILGITLLSICLAAFVGAMIFPMTIISKLIDWASNSRDNINETISGTYMGSFTMVSSISSSFSVLFISIFLQLFGPEQAISYILVFFFGGFLIIVGFLIFRFVKLDES